MPGNPITGLRLQNIRMSFTGGGTAQDAQVVPGELGIGYPDPSHLGVIPAYGIFARHVKDLELADIHFDTETPDQRPAIICDDIDGLDIDHFAAPIVADVPTGHFQNVQKMNLQNAPDLAALKLDK